MSAATSRSTGQTYGVKRVCTVWELARSSYYAWCIERQEGAEGASETVSHPRKRGPVPAVSDADLLAAIRHDLARSPFTGEGHRKVWARLRIVDTIRVSRKRVLRLMREHRLLSPHRPRTPTADPHSGTITTEAPNVMWGTDGARVFTVDEGWVWIFSAVEHWNAECVGWHVTKVGDRFAALEPIAMGLTHLLGSVEAEVARGLSLRMDHGTQYLSDHFLNQIKFWGIHPSFAFVAEPETNGVAERYNRTLKEQIIHGRIYRNVEELRAAVRRFVELYNRQWRIEKRGYLSPIEAREQYELRRAA
jgi:transposase InsO family protein